MISSMDLDCSVRVNHRAYGVLLGALQFSAGPQSGRWGLTAILKLGPRWYTVQRWTHRTQPHGMAWSLLSLSLP